MTSFCSSFPEVSLPSNRSNHYFASVLPHLSELILKIEMQLAIQRTDESKLFPVIVLLRYARLFQALHCAILGCFVQIRTASRRASCRVSSRKIQAFARYQQVQCPCEALRHGFEPASRVLRSDRYGAKR